MGDGNNNARITPEFVVASAIVTTRELCEEGFNKLCNTYAEFCKQELPGILSVEKVEGGYEVSLNKQMTFHMICILCEFFRAGISWISHIKTSKELQRFLRFWYEIAAGTFSMDGGLNCMRNLVRERFHEIVFAMRAVDVMLSDPSNYNNIYRAFKGIDDIELALQILGEDDADRVKEVTAHVEQTFDRHVEKFVRMPVLGKILTQDLCLIDMDSAYSPGHKLSLRKFYKILKEIGFEKELREHVTK